MTLLPIPDFIGADGRRCPSCLNHLPAPPKATVLNLDGKVAALPVQCQACGTDFEVRYAMSHYEIARTGDAMAPVMLLESRYADQPNGHPDYPKKQWREDVYTTEYDGSYGRWLKEKLVAQLEARLEKQND